MNKTLSFEQYWREFGKLHPEVIDNSIPEDVFKNLCQKIWKDAVFHEVADRKQQIEDGIKEGLNDMKEEAYVKAFEDLKDKIIEAIEDL